MFNKAQCILPVYNSVYNKNYESHPGRKTKQIS